MKMLDPIPKQIILAEFLKRKKDGDDTIQKLGRNLKSTLEKSDKYNSSPVRNPEKSKDEKDKTFNLNFKNLFAKKPNNNGEEEKKEDIVNKEKPAEIEPKKAPINSFDELKKMFGGV